MEHGLNSQQMWEVAKDRQKEMLREAQQVALIKQSWPVETQPETNRQSTFDSTFFWPIKIFLRQLFAMRSSSVSG